jgi:hypothetical protein
MAWDFIAVGWPRRKLAGLSLEGGGFGKTAIFVPELPIQPPGARGCEFTCSNRSK